jgi:hypothetical protein
MNSSTRCLNRTELLGPMAVPTPAGIVANKATKSRCWHLNDFFVALAKAILTEVSVGCYGKTNFALYR